MNPERALARALRGPDIPEPATVPEFIELAGSRPALARLSLGLDPTGPLPARGTAQRRAYNNRLRAVQRYSTGGAEKRKPAADIMAQLRAGVAPLIAEREQRERRKWLAALRRRGCRVRVRATIIAIGYTKAEQPTFEDKEMPVGGPGALFSAVQCRAITDAAESSLADGVAVFTAEFARAYSFEVEELEDVGYIHLWLDGEPETR